MSKMTNLVDANGKAFEVNISSITDMTTDLDGSGGVHLEDSEKHKVTNFSVQIVDSDNNPVDVSKLLDEAKTDPSKRPQAIDVLFESTHSGKNRNYFIYHSDSMETDAATWKAPFAKPFLKNHDMYGEPLGRVKDFLFKQSELNPERDCIEVVYRINDQDAIDKFLDGRYRTMSIAGSVGHISCNICGKDIVKDGVFKFCGHWRGETYAGQMALWNARKIEYKEGSVVNSPADDWAQVKKITIVSDSSKNTADNTNQKDGADMSKPAGQTTDSDILDQIDALTKDPAGAEGSAKDDGGEGSSKDDGTGAGVGEGDSTSGGADGTEDGKDGGSEEETLDTVVLQRDNLQAENQTLKDENTALEAKVTDLEAQIATLNDQVRTLSEELKVNSEDAQASRKQSVKFAVMNKKLMAQRIVDFELISNTLTDDKKETRLSELVSKGAKELTEMVDNLATETIKQVRKVANTVTNPGTANLQDTNTVQEGDGGKAKDGEESTKSALTMKDFEDTMIDIITRKK